MYSHKNGFTVIEMLVVIGILGILASLTAFGFRGWQDGIDQRQIQSDLRIAAASMEAAKNFGSGYPLELPGTFESGDGVTTTYMWGDSTQYCIQGTSKRTSSIVYNIRNSQSSTAQSGACAANPFIPNQPNPTIAGTSPTSITVSWSNVANATGYTVRYGTGSPSTVASCSSSPCAVNGLSSSTTYNFSVTADNANGSSTAGLVSGTTQVAPVPAAPSPTIAGTSPTSITVSWGVVSGATSYTVRYGTGSPSTIASGCSSSSCVVNGLNSSTTYNFSVTANNTSGSSTAGLVSGTTQVAVPAAPSPTASSPTTSSITVTWGAVSGATSYTVRYGTSSATITTVAPCSSSACVVNGLTADELYYFTVTATNSSGSSTSSYTTNRTQPIPCNGSYRIYRTGLQNTTLYSSYRYTIRKFDNSFVYNSPRYNTQNAVNPWTFDQTTPNILCPGMNYNYSLHYEDQSLNSIRTYTGSFVGP